MAKHVPTGQAVAIKFYKHADVRDYAEKVLQHKDHGIIGDDDL